jgi:hypothetical protein
MSPLHYLIRRVIRSGFKSASITAASGHVLTHLLGCYSQARSQPEAGFEVNKIMFIYSIME